jgi:hypothetical protein
MGPVTVTAPPSAAMRIGVPMSGFVLSAIVTGFWTPMMTASFASIV